MKIYLAAMAASLLFAGSAGAIQACGGASAASCGSKAEAACGAKAEHVAKVEACGGAPAAACGMKAEQVAKVAKAAGCDAGAAAACATACAVGDAEVVKGGAAGDNVATGYSLGQRVPNFTLADASGKTHNLADYKDSITVLVFYNQDCPYVVEMWDRLDAFTESYSEKGVNVLAIDPTQNRSTESIAKHAEDRAFPILVNSDMGVARNFRATRTPEVFILNKQGVIEYHGAFDNGARGSAEGARQTYAEDAVKALLAGEEPDVRQTRAFGCTIRYPQAEQAAAAPSGT